MLSRHTSQRFAFRLPTCKLGLVLPPSPVVLRSTNSAFSKLTLRSIFASAYEVAYASMLSFYGCPFRILFLPT